MPPELELVRQWLERAAVDLRSAEAVLSADPPITDTACFHSQQAAEKTLKGFLAYRGVEFEHTHQIERLVQQCAEIDPELAELHETADYLTAYAVRFRYPYPGPAPSVAKAQDALQTARQVWEAITSRVPPEALPSS